jgi:hypothetical protein
MCRIRQPSLSILVLSPYMIPALTYGRTCCLLRPHKMVGYSHVRTLVSIVHSVHNLDATLFNMV